MDIKATRPDVRIDPTLTLDVCSEAECRIPILVEKDFKSQGRKSLCTSCLIRKKISSIPPPR
jgi:hypothetical protein